MKGHQRKQAQRKANAPKPNLTGIPHQARRSAERTGSPVVAAVRLTYHAPLLPRQDALAPPAEREADAPSRQTVQGAPQDVQRRPASSSGKVQRRRFRNIDEMWNFLCGDSGAENVREIIKGIQGDPVWDLLYQEAAAHVSCCAFEIGKDIETQENKIRGRGGPKYIVKYTPYPGPGQPFKSRYYIGALLHELGHVAVADRYRHITLKEGKKPATRHLIFCNMNFPNLAEGTKPAKRAKRKKRAGTDDPYAPYLPLYTQQMEVLTRNIQQLRDVVKKDKKLKKLPADTYDYLFGEELFCNHNPRLEYLDARAFDHYDVVLGEIMFHMRALKQTDTDTYRFIHRMLSEANDRRNQRSSFSNEMPYAIKKWSLFSPSTWHPNY